MNVIKVNVNFKNRTIYKQGVDLTSGDYNSTKLVFEFDRQDGRKVFEMKNPDGNLVLLTDIENNEIDLVGKDVNGNNASLFDQEGKYVFEISLYDGDSKLTSAFDYIKVKQEQVIVAGEVVKPYLPIFDELMNDVNTAISETNNLDIDIQTTKDNTEVVITRKDGTEKRAIVSNGGVSNYSDLENKPKINNVELVDNKSLSDLGIENYDDTEIRNALNNKANTSDIPDVSQFITISVNNLVNYLLKSETYTRTEVNNLISAIEKATFEVVNQLPATGVSNVIYLVPSSNPKTQNVKDEYIWINNAWEQIGSTQVDLTGYATETWVNTQISAFLTQSQIETLINSAVSGKLNTSKVKNETSTIAGDVYDVRYINLMIGDIENLLGGI